MFLIFFVYFLCRYRRYAQFLCFFLHLATIHTRLFAKLTEGSEIWWRHRQGLRHHGSWWVSWVTCLTCTGWYCYNTDTDIFKNRRKSHPQRLKLVIHNFQNVSPTDTHNCCSCRFAPPPPPRSRVVHGKEKPHPHFKNRWRATAYGRMACKWTVWLELFLGLHHCLLGYHEFHELD